VKYGRKFASGSVQVKQFHHDWCYAIHPMDAFSPSNIQQCEFKRPLKANPHTHIRLECDCIQTVSPRTPSKMISQGHSTAQSPSRSAGSYTWRSADRLSTMWSTDHMVFQWFGSFRLLHGLPRRPRSDADSRASTLGTDQK